ncbi:uncharacterized protein LOC135108329 isoform X2 [Scylla paramamosain]
MKTAARVSRSLTLLAVLLLVVVFLTDTAEAQERRNGRGRGRGKGRGNGGGRLKNNKLEQCVCGEVDGDSVCSTCFDETRTNPDTATLASIKECLTGEGISFNATAGCHGRSRRPQ